MNHFPGKVIKEEDREELTRAAYRIQELYDSEKTWYDAIHKANKEFPNVQLWQLEGMWKAIDAYVDSH